MADVDVVLAAIEEGRRTARRSSLPERAFRDAIQPVLAQALADRGVYRPGRDEVSLAVPAPADAASLDAPLESRGRADAIYNRFVIEFEPPGALRPSVAHSATRHAIEQVQQYMRGMEHGHGLQLERVAGCAFDGNWIVYVRWERGGWRVARPVRVDRTSLRALIDTIESLATGRGLTAENLEEDFGRTGPIAGPIVKALADLFLEGEASGRGLSMFQQWRIDLANASGPFSPGDMREWKALCGQLGVRPDEAASAPVLFGLQTYFSLVAKLLGVVILEGATEQQLLDDSGALTGREFFEEVESGRLTAPAGAINVIEPGIFSWYLEEKSDDLTLALTALSSRISEYTAEVVEITPLAARDVLKDLYQRLLPRAIRHRLGEYYTPDWLAQRVINQVTGRESALDPRLRVLDPACGSGTFLVEIISRMVDGGRDRPHSETLARILENVVGFDLSPLAVQASKVNYLLALAPLLREHLAEPVFIPVYLADSVSPPRRGGMLEGDVYTFDSAEGEWRIPAPIADSHFLPVLGEILREASHEDRDADWVREQLMTRLPLSLMNDAAIVEESVRLHGKLRDLDKEGRDGMWWQLISNAFAPALQGQFDIVVGNPPWVSWETLPEAYRRSNEDLWLRYQLRPDAPPERRQASSNVPLDISMLFVARCVDRYLVDGGRLGFVITASVFKSELAGRGFRRRHLPAGGRYRFRHIDDMTGLVIFEGATNQTAVVVAEKRESRTDQVPVALWRGQQRRTIPTSLELEQVVALTSRRNLFAEPVSPRDDGSPLLMMPRSALEASRSVRRPSPYLDRIRKGIDTRGANGIFFVEVLERTSTTCRVRNLPNRGRNSDVPQIEGEVEAGVVKDLLRGENVARGEAEPDLGLLLFHDEEHVSNPIPPTDVQRSYPHAFAYVSQFKHFLESRRPFRNFNPTGDGWLGIYSVTTAALATHKVVSREIANGMVAAAVHGAHVIPDHKLYVIQVDSADEADRLAAVLNSAVVRYLVKSFSLSTSITGSFLRYVGIRSISEVADWESAQAYASALGISVDEYTTLDNIARTELGE
jgi:SAM-dependent methyltransferase